jgi:hypothetical protein
MKDQYFGDVNDFKKYGLLRALSDSGELTTAVCWTLTEDDTRPDGGRIAYLHSPGDWRKFDPVVFDHLRQVVVGQHCREVRAIESSGIIPRCRFFTERVRDHVDQRDQYFDRFFRFAAGADLVFFDPDNGLGVKSVERGAKRSSKYLYLCELKRAYAAGHSVMVYQHYPRRPRLEFLSGVVSQLSELGALRHIVAFSTSHVVFLLLLQPHHEKEMFPRIDAIRTVWRTVIDVHLLSTRGCDCHSPRPASGGRRPATLASAASRGWAASATVAG